MASVQKFFNVLVLALLVATSSAYNYIEDVGNDFAPHPTVSEDTTYVLPKGFLFGAASAAYQIEGGWNASGKGTSIWDDLFHKEAYLHRDNGDVAADSYHKYHADVMLSKYNEFNSYRFSLSWSRLLPDGTVHNVNKDGVNYYNNLINDLIQNGITPVVTIYHWDLPSALEAQGGWAGGSSIQDNFVEYAKFCYKTFGDRVRWWITLNESHSFCTIGYERGYETGLSFPSKGVGTYLCSYNALMAHAKAYRAYYDEYSHQGGQVGIVNDITNAHPLDSNNKDDQEAADRYMEFQYAWFADPVMFGDYPESMRNAIESNSIREGRTASRLPVFSDEDKKLLIGSTDFLGTNHYTTLYATPAVYNASSYVISYDEDIGVTTSVDPSWILGPHSATSTPWGFRRILNWVKNRYGNIPIFVTENGYNGNEEEGLDDYNRVALLSTYIRALLRAVHEDNCNIIGYMVWSLLDNLEWTFGYDYRYGINYVDYKDPSRKRKVKKSATFLRGVARSGRVPYFGFRPSGDQVPSSSPLKPHMNFQSQTLTVMLCIFFLFR